jgi:flavin reductase (DIM6/NTAB) family NADH-FMN oxidoreductase RutF
VVDRLSEPVERAFDALLGSLDFPMFVVTTAAVDDGELSGCLVGFATQCSIHPRRYLTCISTANHTASIAGRAEALAVHLVPRGREAIAELFGQETGDSVDKFVECAWKRGPHGVPLLDDCPVRFVGRIVERVPLGDHTGYLLEPLLAEGHASGAADHLRFQDLKDMDAGHPA